MPRTVSLLLTSIVLTLVSGGCAPAAAKLITVNGTHAFAKPCIEKGKLDRAIDNEGERRRQVRQQIATAATAFRRGESRLHVSSVAAPSEDGFRCRPEFEIGDRPALAYAGESADYFGLAVCSGSAAACAGAPSPLDALCEAEVRSVLTGGASVPSPDFEAAFRVFAIQLAGDVAESQGESGLAMLARGWALVEQMQQIQSCTADLSQASRDLHELWSFERRYVGREQDLVPICQGWLDKRDEHLRELAELRLSHEQIESELAVLREQHDEVQREISANDLRCG